MIPRRVQRSRAKGWKMPENTVYVGRPSRHGNPYEIDVFGRELALLLFSRSIDGYWTCDGIPGKLVSEAYRAHEWMQQVRRVMGHDEWYYGLQGKNLACWCPLDQPCHADLLLKLANGHVEAQEAPPARTAPPSHNTETQ